MGSVTEITPAVPVNRNGVALVTENDRGLGWPVRWYMELKGWEAGREYYRYIPVNSSKPNGAMKRQSIKESELHALFLQMVPQKTIIPGISRVLYLPEDFDRVYEHVLRVCTKKECR